MDALATAEILSIPCQECMKNMRLVRIEPDPADAKVHLLTFECTNGHVAVTTFSDARTP